MALETYPFDAADFMRNEKEILGFLNACAEEDGDDPAFLVRAIGTAARARANISKLSRSTGLSREGLYKALSENGNPSFATVLKVLAAVDLGIAVVARPAPRKKVARAKAPRKAPAKKRTPATKGNAAR